MLKTRNARKGQIWMPLNSVELRPTRLELKEDGAKDDTASFCLLMEHPILSEMKVYGQVSLEMLNTAMKELGYQIIKYDVTSESITETPIGGN
jgi:hypothetical protein